METVAITATSIASRIAQRRHTRAADDLRIALRRAGDRDDRTARSGSYPRRVTREYSERPDLWLPPLVDKVPVAPAPTSRNPVPLPVRAAAAAAGAIVAFAATYIDPWGSQAPAVLHPTNDIDLATLPGTLMLFVAMWFVLPRVAYRRRDAVLVLVPFLGWGLAALAAWRGSALPYRDWRPRDDERPRLRQVQGSSRYYVLTREDPAAR